MVEAFNTPHANRLFFEYVLGGKPFQTDEHARAIHPGVQPVLRKSLESAAALIFTVGLIYEPFLKGKLVFAYEKNDPIEWRQSSVSKNSDHLRAIIRLIKMAKPDLRIVLTLSPIPIATHFTGSSAIVADCVSKSTLRAAIDEVLRDATPGVSYWPSFEAIRWLGSHVGQIFGTEGENHRHPGPSYIQAVVDEFVSAYFEKES
jgi:hypothetical protein